MLPSSSVSGRLVHEYLRSSMLVDAGPNKFCQSHGHGCSAQPTRIRRSTDTMNRTKPPKEGLNTVGFQHRLIAEVWLQRVQRCWQHSWRSTPSAGLLHLLAPSASTAIYGASHSACPFNEVEYTLVCYDKQAACGNHMCAWVDGEPETGVEEGGIFW